MTHICVSKLTIIGSDNGLAPDRRQAIIWTNAGILLIGPLGTNFNEISIEILTFLFKKMRLKVLSAKRRPFCFGLNVLTIWLTFPRWHFQMCIFEWKLLYFDPKKFVSEDPIDNELPFGSSNLVQVMAWCQTGAKPLPEPMLTNPLMYVYYVYICIYIYICHPAWMNLRIKAWKKHKIDIIL